LRLWNTTDQKQDIQVKTILPVKKVQLVQLDESYISDIPFAGGVAETEIKANQILTLLFV